MSNILEKISSLAKRRGFIYPGSEIYGGLAGTWDYGPLGVELKRNIKDYFWQSMVKLRDDVVGVDAAILMNPKVWEASGHLESFVDPLVECKSCHHRFRLDELGIEIPFPHRTIYWGTGKENEWVKDFADQIASKEKQVKKNKQREGDTLRVLLRCSPLHLKCPWHLILLPCCVIGST